MDKNNLVFSQVEKKNIFRDQQNTFKILVASDNHVGFKEKDPVRGNDSFQAFEEVLKVAKNEKVDFLLLGGDLFHETNPSQQCLYKMLNLLGNYVLGDGEIQYQMPNYEANFQDCNLNIELPIFVIHGNHDYPSDEYGNLSVIDILHATKYLNHFGKFQNIETIKVTPIIFQKGNTVVALYGVGYLKDKFFHKMLEDNKIEFVKPSELGYQNTVNILVIHQNRYKGIKFGQSYRNCVHPEQFPNWMDLIIRGHEHEQLDEVGVMKDCPIVTIQPGSTVLTAIEEVQATPRRAILLEIKCGKANFQDITLIDSYRPVLYENVDLLALIKKAGFNLQEETPSEQQIEEIFWMHIQQSIKSFQFALKENFPDNPQLLDKKKLLRYKVEHSGVDIFNFQKIENKLSEIAANPGEVLKFWKRIVYQPKKNVNNPKLEQEFIKTLEGKSDFDTIGNDAVKDIKELYEKRIKKNKNIQCLPTSLIMNTVEKVNLRNKNSQIEDIVKDLQTKLQGKVVQKEEDEIRKISQNYKYQMNRLLQNIQNNIDGKFNLKGEQDDNNGNKIIYKTLMNNQFDDLRHNVGSKIKNKVIELFTQDFEINDEELNDDKQIDENNKDSDNQIINEDSEQNNDSEEEQTKKKKGKKQTEPKNKKGQSKQEQKQLQNFEQVESSDDDNNKGRVNDKKNFKQKKNLNEKNTKQQKNTDQRNIKREYDNDEDFDFKEKENNPKNNLQMKGDMKKISNSTPYIEDKIKVMEKDTIKKKQTYSELFKKQQENEDEMDYENMERSGDSSQQSDCEFGLEEKKENKKINYNISHISEIQKQNQNRSSLNNQKIQSTIQQTPVKNNILEVKQDYKQLLSKKKPTPPVKEEQSDKNIQDIRNLLKKKITIINNKN